MKRLIFSLFVLTTISFATVTVDGYAYLENQSDHSGINVIFKSHDTGTVSNSVTTEENGYFTVQVETNNYFITYEKDGYFSEDIKPRGTIEIDAKKNEINITSFSLKKKSDIYLMGIKKIKNYFRLKINVKNKIFYFNTKYSTNNFINNILACIATVFVLNLNLNKMKKKFISFKIPEGRGDIKMVKKFNKRFKFIDESYNANLLSMTSAINNMNYYNDNKNHRKLVLLGDMLELGKKSKKFHRALSVIINRSNIDKVFVCGKYIKETFNYLSTNKKGKVFKNIKEVHNHFGKILHNNDLLMVKGSNATGLNQFSKNIKKGQISAI